MSLTVISTFIPPSEYITTLKKNNHIKVYYYNVSKMTTLITNSKSVKCVVLTDNDLTIQQLKGSPLPIIAVRSMNYPNDSLFGAKYMVYSIFDITDKYIETVYNRFYGIPNIISQKNDLIIRELCLDDFTPICNLYNYEINNNCIENFCSNTKIGYDKYTSYIEHQYSFYEYGLWGVFSQNNDLIGHCGLENITINNQVQIELSMLISPLFQSKGYGYIIGTQIINYAKEYLCLEKIIARTTNDNNKCINLLIKLGFEKTQKLDNILLFELYF